MNPYEPLIERFGRHTEPGREATTWAALLWQAAFLPGSVALLCWSFPAGMLLIWLFPSAASFAWALRIGRRHPGLPQRTMVRPALAAGLLPVVLWGLLFGAVLASAEPKPEGDSPGGAFFYAFVLVVIGVVLPGCTVLGAVLGLTVGARMAPHATA